MSATIGAALKKIAVDLLTNPKILKTIVGIVIGIIIVVFFPLIVVISILNGNVDVDTNKLAAIVEENISDERMAQLIYITIQWRKLKTNLMIKNCLSTKLRQKSFMRFIYLINWKQKIL